MNNRQSLWIISAGLAAGIALAVTPSCVFGQTVGVHVGSVHVPAFDGQQNFNPGAYVKHESGFVAGGYRNTLGRASFYAAYAYEPEWAGPFAVTVGVVSGYQAKTRPVACNTAQVAAKLTNCTWTDGTSRGALTLMLAPSVTLPSVAGVTPRLSIIPRIGAARSTVVHFSLEKPL